MHAATTRGSRSFSRRVAETGTKFEAREDNLRGMITSGISVRIFSALVLVYMDQITMQESSFCFGRFWGI